jgi:hypothetical protein
LLQTEQHRAAFFGEVFVVSFGDPDFQEAEEVFGLDFVILDISLVCHSASAPRTTVWFGRSRERGAFRDEG